MSRRAAARWAAGLAVSALAHLGAGATLWAAMRPDPVTEQPSPETRLDMQAMQLDRQEARPAAPQREAAPEGQADSAALAPGAIPRSRARPSSAPSDTLPASPTTAAKAKATATRPAPLAAQSANALPLAGVAAPAETMTAQTPDASATPTLNAALEPAPLSKPGAAPVDAATLAPVATPVVAATTARATPQIARAETLVLSALNAPLAVPLSAPPERAAPQSPDVPAVALTTPRPEIAPPAAQQAATLAPTLAAALPAPSAQPRTDTAAPTTPRPQQAAAAPTGGQKLKATLAFPGGTGDVDPVSLAAFQSFMQPGDVGAGADQLRDGLSGLLAQVPCSRLQVSFDPDTVTLNVKGHVPEAGLRTPVLAALREQMGADIDVSGDILILPRPQCGALSGIADVGLPQSTDQITNPLLVGADTHTRVLDYRDGDRLWFDITAPDYAAFLYVDYFDAGGDVIHLSPNEYAALARAEAKTAARVGVRDPGDTGLQIVIGPPYGQEIAVAFAASAPLYEELRPLVEPAAPYLEWLKAQVAQARAGNPDFKGEWVYFFVTTKAQ